jgi:hypothetical protein
MGTIGRTNNNNIVRTPTTTATGSAAPTAKPAAQNAVKPATVKDGFDSRATGGAAQTVAPAAVFTAPAGAKDKAYDGKLIGAGGKAYNADTPLSQVPGYTPKDGVKKPGTIIYVNGMMTDKATQEKSLQAIADKTGQKTIGIHNSTEGFFKDLGQCITDKMDKGKNPAVDTLADSLYTELKAGRDVHLMAHSQGGLITSRALNDVAKRLRIEDGLSPAQVQEKLGKVSVETFGAAAATYPDGPKYVHYVNDKDPVPGLFGLGTSGKGPLDLLKHAGKDAKIRYFSEKSIFSGAHNINDTYLNQRVPFDQARAG